MSREIKFRIWDNKNKEWLGASDNDVLIYYGFHLVGEVMTVQSLPQWALDNGNIVEQYTGLKDRNNKEIYEGDIVTLDLEWDEDIDYSVITFKNGCFRIGDGYGQEAGYYLSDWRVVGNIHENPELLGGEDD